MYLVIFVICRIDHFYVFDYYVYNTMHIIWLSNEKVKQSSMMMLMRPFLLKQDVLHCEPILVHLNRMISLFMLGATVVVISYTNVLIVH